MTHRSHRKTGLYSLWAAFALLGTPAHAGGRRAPAGPLEFTGVNLSGGEFGERKPGETAAYGRAYIYPSAGEMDYFRSRGVNIVRFPLHWVDLQPKLNGPLDPAALGRVWAVVKDADSRGLVLILDPHDYARYGGKVVGTADVPDAAFADFWGRMAAQFRYTPRVWFGLMNEPHDLPAAQWLGSANAAIAAIRRAGAGNIILVPGIAWTGAHSWVSSGSGAAMLGVRDPLDHYLFEAHQYLDSDSSGSHPEAVSATVGSERLRGFTFWCRQHNRRAFLGEIGSADNPTAARATDDLLTFMESNRDVWVGFTWWSAGPWWGEYMFTLEPKGGQDRPQMATLRPHLRRRPVK